MLGAQSIRRGAAHRYKVIALDVIAIRFVSKLRKIRSYVIPIVVIDQEDWMVRSDGFDSAPSALILQTSGASFM